MTGLTSANLKTRSYIRVRLNVVKELDISMSAIGFARERHSHFNSRPFSDDDFDREFHRHAFFALIIPQH